MMLYLRICHTLDESLPATTGSAVGNGEPRVGRARAIAIKAAVVILMMTIIDFNSIWDEGRPLGTLMAKRFEESDN